MIAVLNCGHTFPVKAEDVNAGQHELRDRCICDDCFDQGAPEYHRYIVRFEQVPS